MTTKTILLSAAERFDAWLPTMPWRGSAKVQHLRILLCHSLYHHQCDAENAGVFPHERMTLGKLRVFLEYFLQQGYAFVSPADLRSSSRLPDKAMMLTVDDGYFNFVHALPILHELQIPVTLFVCPGYIENDQSFWWDAFYRNARAGGGSESKVRREISRLRKKSFDEIQRHITDCWGDKAMHWTSDLDRPLSLDEFREIARDSLVHVGNHTLRHTALPFQTAACIRSEILLAEEFFRRETGQRTKVISYPNGDYSDAVIEICEQLGYELGMTIEACRNKYTNSTTGSQRLSLGRFMLSGERDVKRQAKSIDRPFSISGAIRRMKKHKHK